METIIGAAQDTHAFRATLATLAIAAQLLQTGDVPRAMTATESSMAYPFLHRDIVMFTL